MARIYRSPLYRAMVPGLLRLFGPVHVVLYRLFRGRLVGRMAQGFIPVLLLTTVGRKSGRKRTQPVGYVRDGSAILIVGSNSGLPSNPGWIFNLRARPEADVELDARQMHVRARVLAGDERVRAWRVVTSRYAFFNQYQSAIDRTIPIVSLDVMPRATPTPARSFVSNWRKRSSSSGQRSRASPVSMIMPSAQHCQ